MSLARDLKGDYKHRFLQETDVIQFDLMQDLIFNIFHDS